MPDPDATLGWAGLRKSAPPYVIGLFDNTTQKGLLEVRLTSADIKRNGYNLYYLGTSVLTSDCYLYMGDMIDRKCVEAFNRASPNQLYDVYVSLKFEGPTFGTNASEDRVHYDKIVFVRK